MRWRLLGGLVLVATLTVGFSTAYAGQQGLYGGRLQSQRNRRAAFADAATLLARLRVPQNAGLRRAVPYSQLHELEEAMNHADFAARWTVPGTLRSVISYVRLHPPPGSSYFSSGYDGNPGSITSRSITFAWPPIDEALGDRHLFVGVSSAHQGKVELYAQAESIWLSARPQGERFPASVRRVVLRVRRPHQASLMRTVTRPSTVSRIVARFNAVPITQPDTYNCPAFTDLRSFSYSLLSESGGVLAQVRYEVPPRAAPGPCDAMSVVIAGHPQHVLLGGPQVVDIQRIFHISTDNNYL